MTHPTYTVEIDVDEDGVFAPLIARDVLDVRWRLGMDAPFADVAPVSWAQVTLRNPDGRYSPATGVGPVEIGQTLRVSSDDGATVRTHFVGTLTTITPSPGADGPRTAVIRAEGPLRALSHNRVRPGAFLDARADQVVDAVLRQVPFRPRYLAGVFLVGMPGRAELGLTTTLPNAAQMVRWTLQPGVSRFAFVGDDWEDGVLALAAIREVVAAERGRLFVDRHGDIVLFNRQEALLRTSAVATFDGTMSGLTLTHGADTVSRVGVTMRPRRVGGNDDVLWRLGSSQRLPPQQEMKFTVRFRGEAGEQIGALRVFQPRPVIDYTVNAQPDGNGADLTSLFDLDVLESDAASARLRIVNLTTTDAYLVAGAVVRGRALYTGDPLTVEATDGLSGTFYGPHEFALVLPGLTEIADADNIARYELTRRKEPRTHAQALTLRGVAARAQVLARTLFDRITIADGGTGQNGDYFIVAEDHQVGGGGVAHTVTWTLEPANPGAFWLVGSGRLGADTTLAY
jgi:hypothetical protein